MLYSQLFGKTKKEAPKDELSQNAQLLSRAGFIYKELAGVYDLLPLGLKVSNKIENIIREEMTAIGGQELFLTSLQNPEVWKTAGRWNDEVVDNWFKTKLKNGMELGLGFTHEEALACMLTKYVQSYKDLPLYVFQIQTKFRNEARAKSGMLRTREFLMKDLYSFNKTEEEQDAFYEKAKQAYTKVFEREGIGDMTFLTFASGGSFSKYSHEFQTITDAGEDTIYLSREKKIAVNREVYTDEVLNMLGLKKEELEEVRAVEVGNIFKQGTKYTVPAGLTFTNENGEQKPVIMGAYGIGVGRQIAAIAEIHHDDKGLIWPESVAPYKVHLVGLNLEDSAVKAKAEALYHHLESLGLEVLYDDRADTAAGEKFGDADLIGIPYRVVVSKKTGDQVEVKKRCETESKMMTVEEFVNLVK